MIKNKIQSTYEIRKRGLNHIAEKIFGEDSISELESFLNENPRPYYNIRDKSCSIGKFLYRLTRDEVLAHSKDYKMFSVYESLCDADEKLVIQGDIFISKDFEMIASLDDRKGIPLRFATIEPKYNLSIDLKERREPPIPGLTEAIDYIIKHGLLNMYVELSVYEICVGIKQENILVWELRNY